MPPAARIGDLTSHTATPVSPGVPNGALAGTGVISVLIGGRPAATISVPPRLVAINGCAIHPQLGPLNVVLPAPSPRGQVFIGRLPAARMGDRTTCGAAISGGALNVMIGG
jgi:uncharacterized Zn-binding protein involved in type VI secretion